MQVRDSETPEWASAWGHPVLQGGWAPATTSSSTFLGPSQSPWRRPSSLPCLPTAAPVPTLGGPQATAAWSGCGPSATLSLTCQPPGCVMWPQGIGLPGEGLPLTQAHFVTGKPPNSPRGQVWQQWEWDHLGGVWGPSVHTGLTPDAAPTPGTWLQAEMQGERGRHPQSLGVDVERGAGRRVSYPL